jgi:uncharacterized FAD-dependent dehydrogenase
LGEVLGEGRSVRLTEEVDRLFVSHDGTSRVSTPSDDSVLEHDVLASGLRFKKYSVRHYGTDTLKNLNEAIFRNLSKAGVEFRFRSRVLAVDGGRDAEWVVSFEQDGQIQRCPSDFVVFAPGKRGSRWMKQVGDALRLEFEPQPVRLGVRIETERRAVARLLGLGFDPKLYTEINGRKVKLHCFCDGGELLALDYDGVRVVGGHSACRTKTAYTSFGVLTEVWPRHGQSSRDLAEQLLASFRTKLGNRIGRESLSCFLGDNSCVTSDAPMGTLVGGYCSTEVSSLLPRDVVERIRLFVMRLIELCPTIRTSNAWVYSPAVEWWYDRIAVDPEAMETRRKGIFAVGDGAGWSQGIVHAAATGVIAADAISKRLSERA